MRAGDHRDARRDRRAACGVPSRSAGSKPPTPTYRHKARTRSPSATVVLAWLDGRAGTICDVSLVRSFPERGLRGIETRATARCSRRPATWSSAGSRARSGAPSAAAPAPAPQSGHLVSLARFVGLLETRELIRFRNERLSKYRGPRVRAGLPLDVDAKTDRRTAREDA